ncbi:protein GVQW3-like [Linepithema humile]|uniref:protein GVQW3-like n=1 Tax=Linepithema humile TaxID=83485 RepID=UPI00351E4BDF
MEQRAVIKFNFKLGKTATETYESMKIVYGDDCLSRSKVFEWYKRFKEGRESLKDDARTGRPTTSSTDANIAKIRDLLLTDHHLTCRMIAEEVNMAKTIVHEIIRNVLMKRKVCAKFFPHSLTPEQKEQRVIACRNLIEMTDEDNSFLQKIITGDESWCFQYEPTTKRQSAEWLSVGESKPTKVRMTKSKTKIMLIIFFDAQGIIHKEFVPPRITGDFPFLLGCTGMALQ